MPENWTNAQLDAAYAAFQAHARGSEFNEFGEHVCSECGYAYSWPEGDKGRYHVEYNRSKRHIARAALEAARAHEPSVQECECSEFARQHGITDPGCPAHGSTEREPA